MTDRKGGLAAILLMPMLLVGMQLLAQSNSQKSSPDEDAKGFTSYASFEGSSNTLGQVMTLDSSVGYKFNKHFETDLGLPIYFVTNSATATKRSTSNNGIGNLYLRLLTPFKNPLLNYTSTITASAPSGDPKKGLGTGRPGIDWSNRFDHDFDALTPFFEVGIGNGTPDTMLFRRPFASLGFVSHFDAGAEYNFGKFFTLGASLYEIVPSGQQKIFSRLVQAGAAPTGTGSHNRSFQLANRITGTSSLVRDDGFSTWVEASPSVLDLELGFTHSVHFDLNTVSFTIGMNIGKLMKASRH